jgi:transposase
MVRALRQSWGPITGQSSASLAQLEYGIESVPSCVHQADIGNRHAPSVSSTESQHVKVQEDPRSQNQESQFGHCATVGLL